MDSEIISWLSLGMACILAIERIFKRIKHCESGCCKVDMNEKDIDKV